MTVTCKMCSQILIKTVPVSGILVPMFLIVILKYFQENTKSLWFVFGSVFLGVEVLGVLK